MLRSTRHPEHNGALISGADGDSLKIENIADLQVLVQTARAGSLTGAAAAMGVTPSAASATLKRLESQLGTRLFERSTRAMRLTPDGQTLLAEPCHRSDRGRRRTDTEERLELTGTIRLATPSDLGCSTP